MKFELVDNVGNVVGRCYFRDPDDDRSHFSMIDFLSININYDSINMNYVNYDFVSDLIYVLKSHGVIFCSQLESSDEIDLHKIQDDQDDDELPF